MLPAAADQRIQLGVASTLRWVNVDEDGTPTDAAGTVTVGIDLADGTELVAAGTATAHAADADSVGVYTYTLAADALTQLDQLTVTWTDDAAGSHETVVDVAGRFFFTIADVRGYDSELADADKYPTSLIVTARDFVERECEDICARAWVPRFARLTLDGTGEREMIIGNDDMPGTDLRAVLAASIDGTDLTATELADLTLAQHYRIARPDGDVWTEGRSNVVLSILYGREAPDPDLRLAALARTREVLSWNFSGMPVRGTSVDLNGLGRIDLAKPGKYETGNTRVDPIYWRRSLRNLEPDAAGGVATTARAGAPYSRPLEMDPQYDSLYHGGRR